MAWKASKKKTLFPENYSPAFDFYNELTAPALEQFYKDIGFVKRGIEPIVSATGEVTKNVKEFYTPYPTIKGAEAGGTIPTGKTGAETGWWVAGPLTPPEIVQTTKGTEKPSSVLATAKGGVMGPGVNPMESFINSNLPIMKSLVNRMVSGDAGRALQDPNAMKNLLKLAENEQKESLSKLELSKMQMQNTAMAEQRTWERDKLDTTTRMMMGLAKGGLAPQQYQTDRPASAQGVPSQADIVQLQAQSAQFLEPMAAKIAQKSQEMAAAQKMASMQNDQHYFNTLFTGGSNLEVAKIQRESVRDLRQWQSDTAYAQKKELMGLTNTYKDQGKLVSAFQKWTLASVNQDPLSGKQYDPKLLSENMTSFINEAGGDGFEKDLTEKGLFSGKYTPEQVEAILTKTVQDNGLPPMLGLALMRKYYPDYNNARNEGEVVK